MNTKLVSEPSLFDASILESGGQPYGHVAAFGTHVPIMGTQVPCVKYSRQSDFIGEKAVQFPVWLRTEMDRQGVSVTELARLLGVNHTVVSAWRNGRRQPKAHNVRAIAAALGVDEDVALIAAGAKAPDPYLNPDSPLARLTPLIEQVDWDSHPELLRALEGQLRMYLDWDRQDRETKE